MPKIWLITGSGNGLGRDIAEAALAAGDSVLAGARRTEELAPAGGAIWRAGEARYAGSARRGRSKGRRAVSSGYFRTAGCARQQCRLWAVCAIRADECGGLPGRRGHLLLRSGVHHARRRARDAQAEERSHLSGVFSRWPPRGCRQYAVSRGQVGRGRFQRFSGNGSRAVRGQDLHTGARRYSDQLGTACRSECAGPAAGL